MDKKLIKEIVRKYLESNIKTMQAVSDFFAESGIKISTSKISEALHLAISQNVVDMNTAKAIANKAIYNSKRHSGYDKKIRQKYDELFKLRKEFIEYSKKYTQLEIHDTKSQNVNFFTNKDDPQKDFFLETFYDSFGDSDDFEINIATEKDELEEKYEKYKESLK